MRMRFRDRVFPVVTALLAGACVIGGEALVEYVQRMHSVRVLGAAMAGSAAQQPLTPSAGMARRLFPGMSPMVAPRESPEEAQRRQAQVEHLKRQIGIVEGTIYVWRRVMWGVGGVLGALALLAAITARVRLFHLLAAVVVVLSTGATLTGMWLLISPAYGAMPPLAWQTWVLVGLVNGFYAIVLLIAFARVGRPQSAPVSA